MTEKNSLERPAVCCLYGSFGGEVGSLLFFMGVHLRVSPSKALAAHLVTGALDINEDGKINDGKELFGTASGNGFGDLAAYDQDNNGWIDEKCSMPMIQSSVN